MLEVQRGVEIAPRSTSDQDLSKHWNKTGEDVARELGGRYLLRYIQSHQVDMYLQGSRELHFTTPTPYSPEDLVKCLSLPSPDCGRHLVMLLDPAKIGVILGPRWIRFGNAIEYVLPKGFTEDALAKPWAQGLS